MESTESDRGRVGGVGARARGTVETSIEAGGPRCRRREVALACVSRRDARLFRPCELLGVHREIVRLEPANNGRKIARCGSAGGVAGARAGSALRTAQLVRRERAHSSRGARHRKRMDRDGSPETPCAKWSEWFQASPAATSPTIGAGQSSSGTSFASKSAPKPWQRFAKRCESFENAATTAWTMTPRYSRWHAKSSAARPSPAVPATRSS